MSIRIHHDRKLKHGACGQGGHASYHFAHSCHDGSRPSRGKTMPN